MRESFSPCIELSSAFTYGSCVDLGIPASIPFDIRCLSSLDSLSSLHSSLLSVHNNWRYMCKSLMRVTHVSIEASQLRIGVTGER